VIAKKFGIFDDIENIPGTPTSRLFEDRLTLIKMADEAGLAGYHLAEHHGSDLCMAPGPQLFTDLPQPVPPRLGKKLPYGRGYFPISQAASAQPMKMASGNSALTMYWPASTISEILRSTARLHSR
jgi:alkanesulfonate monooxygenase SsuD/methylene tetrahydromethanopterin reductase-like flavin-dependent oxidoreductase (luciferase family)